MDGALKSKGRPVLGPPHRSPTGILKASLGLLFTGTPAGLTQANLLGELGALLGVVRSRERVVLRQPPLFLIALRRQIMCGRDMALEHLLLVAALQADDR